MMTEALGLEVTAWLVLAALAGTVCLLTWSRAELAKCAATLREARALNMAVQRALTLASMGLFEPALNTLRDISGVSGEMERAEREAATREGST